MKGVSSAVLVAVIGILVGSSIVYKDQVLSAVCQLQDPSYKGAGSPGSDGSGSSDLGVGYR